MRSIDLRRIKGLLEKSVLNESEAAHVMSLMRSEIEFNQLVSQYQVLKLYCDWMLHPTIDRNVYAFDLMRRLTESMLFYSGYTRVDSPDHNLLFPAIYQMVVEPLRKQLNKFACEYEISASHFVELQKWSRFFYHITAGLLDRRIKFPSDPISNPKSKSYYQAILEVSNGTPLAVEGFYYSVQPSRVPTVPGKVVSWNLLTFSQHNNHRMTVMGPLVVPTGQMRNGAEVVVFYKDPTPAP